MRRDFQKSARARNRDGAGVSLFPFMAVLISTMGALILLLVVFARQARLQADQADQAQDAEFAQEQEDLERALAAAARERNGLEKARQRTGAQLTQAQIALGKIEDHARRLREELVRLQAAGAELDRCETEGGRRYDRYRTQLAAIESKTDLARRQLDQTRRNVELRERSYAIIPYQGPNQTRRRPIYIECRSDSVVLQPEAIQLTPEDFVGPMGPGNPLDAALRAVREHIRQTGAGQDGQQPAEPYPLLLVRPSGIVSYGVARAAMQSWGSDFGYELIEEDWEVEFDEPDPELTRRVAEVVAETRRRRAQLARIAPRHYGRHEAPTYAVTPYRGGVTRIGGRVQESGKNGPFSDGTGWGGGWPSSSGMSAGRSTQSSAGRSTERTPGHAIGNSGTPASQVQPGGRVAAGHGTPQSSGQGSGQGESGQAGQPAGGQAGMQGSKGPEGASAGGPENASIGGDCAPRPGEWTPQPASDEPSRSSGPSSNEVANSLADIRGRNWALPDAANGSIGITRPIHVECDSARLELVPNGDRASGHVVALGDRTEDTIDTFISAVWDQMKSWGIAGRGMYWQPILDVQVAPGAEQRFADLRGLLDRSGLQVRRRQ